MMFGKSPTHKNFQMIEKPAIIFRTKDQLKKLIIFSRDSPFLIFFSKHHSMTFEKKYFSLSHRSPSRFPGTTRNSIKFDFISNFLVLMLANASGNKVKFLSMFSSSAECSSIPSKLDWQLIMIKNWWQQELDV